MSMSCPLDDGRSTGVGYIRDLWLGEAFGIYLILCLKLILVLFSGLPLATDLNLCADDTATNGTTSSIGRGSG